MGSPPGVGQQSLAPVARGVASGLMWGESGAAPPLWGGVSLEEEILQPPTPHFITDPPPPRHQPHWVLPKSTWEAKAFGSR